MRTLVALGALVLAAAAGSVAHAAEAVSHPFACTDNGHNKVFVVSAAGKIVWEYPCDHGQDVWMLENGNVLFSHRLGATEVTRDKKVAWEYTTAKPNEVHGCQPLPDGRVLVVECGPARLIEVDRQGKVAKEIKIPTAIKSPHLQFRVARKTPQGTYLVAHVGEDKVCEYDGEGKLLRTVQTPPKYPFVAVRLPNGNTLVASGDGHKLIEVDPDGKTVWQIDENELPGHPLRFVAGVQRLPNGNTVVCNWGGHGYLGKQPQVFEVTRDKKVVWQVFDAEQFRTISSIHLLDVPGDPAKGEILR